MSEFEGARFSLMPKHIGGKPVQAIEVVTLPKRKRPCLLIDNCDGTGEPLAYFIDEDSANKFIKFMTIVVQLDRRASWF